VLRVYSPIDMDVLMT